MKIQFLFAIVFCVAQILTATDRLQISNNGRYLQKSDGSPFFYLGDTAWELFHRLNREESDRYLADRAEKGFTVIQAVVLSQIGGLSDPNPYGHVPLQDNDPTKPLEDYFNHVDYIVDKANELGLVIGMLPTWGSYWKSNNRNAIFDAGNAEEFGNYLGKRYRDKELIWILGGDENIVNKEELNIIRAMAAGLRKGDDGAHLITFHPRGPGLSSDVLHTEDWLDFNMVQSSHGAHDHDNGLFAENDYALSPAKPTLDGEPRYETIPVGFYFDGFNRLDHFDDYDCRQAAYWSLLAGACGHTYGNNNIWQMWAPQRNPVLGANIPWYQALDHPGAFQMGLLRKLFESRPFEKLVPRQDFILDGPQTGGGKIRAAVASDSSFAFIYSPRGEKFTVDIREISGDRNNVIWFDPRYGVAYKIHTPDTKGIQTFTPPTSGRGNDWLLILENTDLNFGTPGK